MLGSSFLHRQYQEPGRAVNLCISLTWPQIDKVKPGQCVMTERICSLPWRSYRLSSMHESNSLCIQGKMKRDQIQCNFTKALTSQTNPVSLLKITDSLNPEDVMEPVQLGFSNSQGDRSLGYQQELLQEKKQKAATMHRHIPTTHGVLLLGTAAVQPFGPMLRTSLSSLCTRVVPLTTMRTGLLLWQTLSQKHCMLLWCAWEIQMGSSSLR